MFDYSRISYHRRSLLAQERAFQQVVHGRTLQIGGARDYWFLDRAGSVVGLDVVHDPEISIDVLGDVQALPFQDESFDTVVALEVIEHIPHPELMVREIYRVLKVGGHLVLSAPFLWRVHRTPKDYWRFTRDGFESLLGEFSHVRIIPVNGPREAFMHFLYQYVEVLLDKARLPHDTIVVIKPLEWLVFVIMGRNRTDDPMWTTGWFAVAER